MSKENHLKNLLLDILSIICEINLSHKIKKKGPRIGLNILKSQCQFSEDFFEISSSLYGPFSEKWKIYSDQWCEGTWWLAVAP